MTTLNAYLTKYSSLKAHEIYDATQEQLADGLHFTKHIFTDDQDFVLVGSATVEVTLMPRAEVVTTHVAALRKQAENIKAEAGVAVMRIEQQINSLLAIENATEVQP